MSIQVAPKGKGHRFRLPTAEQLTRPERIALLVLVGGAVLLDVIGIILAPDADLLNRAFGATATLAFALFIWSPLAATSALGVTIALSFVAGNAIGTVLAGALAALLVLRLASTPLVLGYFAGLVTFSSLLAYGYGNREGVPVGIAVYLITAALAGGVGMALRLSLARGRRLEHELSERAEHERQAVLAERRWIAGELHDSIAHHLTVVALHVQLLDDEEVRTSSQEAIRVAARKALSDLRFVIELAEDTPHGAGVPSGDLAIAIEEAREELAATGHPTACDGNPTDERIPRGVEIILARIVRESATNALKYAGCGEVRFALEIDSGSITLTIRSPLPTTPRRDLPSTGTGLNRMAERVLGVSGEFSAGPVDDAWLVTARLPVA